MNVNKAWRDDPTVGVDPALINVMFDLVDSHADQRSRNHQLSRLADRLRTFWQRRFTVFAAAS